MARRKREHQIGDRSIKLVLNAVPDHWVEQEQKKDYGIDIRFEVFKNERTSGQEFGVQVRGSDRVKKSSRMAFVTADVDVEALIDHLEKRRYPVYLFRVDNSSQTIYWEFLQRYLSDLSSPTWRTQRTLRIRIPVSQTLSDPAQFEKELAQHVSYVNNLHPGTVEAAISKVARDVRKIDPRLDAVVTVVDGQVTQKIVAREDLTIHVHAEGDDATALDELVRRGVSAKLNAAKLSGSPLFEKLGFVQVEISNQPDRGFRFQVWGVSNGRPIGSIDLAGVEVVGGLDEFRIQTLECHPISVKGRFLSQAKTKHDCSVSFNISIKPWINTAILDLPYFDDSYGFLSAIKSCDAIQTVIRKGSIALPSLMTPMPEGIADLIDVLERVKQARELAIFYRINPPFCLDFDREGIRILHWLTFDRTPIRTDEMILNNPASMHLGRVKKSIVPTIDSPGRTRQTAERIAFDVFGQEVAIGPVSFDYSNIVCREVKQLPKDFRLGEDETVIEFLCSPETMVTAKLDPLPDAAGRS